jgi:hypothetical protein
MAQIHFNKFKEFVRFHLFERLSRSTNEIIFGGWKVGVESTIEIILSERSMTWIHLDFDKKIISVEVCQQHSLMIVGQIRKFDEDLGLSKISLRLPTVDDQGSTDFGKDIMHPKEAYDSRWSIVGCQQIWMEFGRSMNEIILSGRSMIQIRR